MGWKCGRDSLTSTLWPLEPRDSKPPPAPPPHAHTPFCGTWLRHPRTLTRGAGSRVQMGGGRCEVRRRPLGSCSRPADPEAANQVGDRSQGHVFGPACSGLAPRATGASRRSPHVTSQEPFLGPLPTTVPHHSSSSVLPNLHRSPKATARDLALSENYMLVLSLWL